MKTFRFILIAAAALLFSACKKETSVIIPQNPQEPETATEKITFSAGILIDPETRASLSGLDIHWTDGDHIGIATDKGTSIENCTITVNPSNPKACSFKVTPVDGAKTYYAIYTGADNFSGITFNNETETFAGNAKGMLAAVEEFYSATSVTAADLTMAGKTATTSITMKPCLALLQIKVAEESVKSKYQTIKSTGYSGVRGWKIKQLGSSKYSSGDYTVNLSEADPAVTPNSNYTRKEGRTFSSADLLSKDATYYTCIIPGGSIKGFQIDFMGFTSESEITFDPVYTLSLVKSLTIAPGDFYSFGTLDPLTTQKSKNEFTPAINIDGSMTDWADVATAYSTKDTEADTYIVQWKTTSDTRYVYFYYKIKKSSISYNSGSYDWGSYVQTYYDTNKNGNNDARTYVYPFKGSTEGTIEFKTGLKGVVEVPVDTKMGEYVATNGTTDANYAYVEISVPRSLLGITATGKEIIVRHQMVSGGQTTSGQTITLQ